MLALEAVTFSLCSNLTTLIILESKRNVKLLRKTFTYFHLKTSCISSLDENADPSPCQVSAAEQNNKWGGSCHMGDSPSQPTKALVDHLLVLDPALGQRRKVRQVRLHSFTNILFIYNSSPDNRRNKLSVSQFLSRHPESIYPFSYLSRAFYTPHKHHFSTERKSSQTHAAPLLVTFSSSHSFTYLKYQHD